MEIFDVLILSLVEGATEFLPISSTAHLILTSHILNLPKDNFLTTFEISIQLGAIASVVYLYAYRLYQNKELLAKALVGFIPTGILGIFLYNYIKILLNDPFVPVVMLFIGGVAIILIERYFGDKARSINLPQSGKLHLKHKTLSKMPYKDALWIGFIQSISMIPGVSRAAASIFGAMALKYKRQDAVEFSFLLAIPTMLAATGYDLFKEASNLTVNQTFYIAVGMIFSFISALVVIKWLIKYVQNNNFVLFGIYRIVLSILYFLVFLR